MTNESFIDLVRRMREAQKRWFRLSDSQDLLGAKKKLEREVDHFLEREAGPRAAPTLFDIREHA